MYMNFSTKYLKSILTMWFTDDKLKLWLIDYKPKEVKYMDDMKLGVVESRFADIIWSNEPLHSRDLVKLCQEQLNWKKPTTYTVLRKLCERGLFQNADGMVSSLITRKEYYAMQSEKFVEDTFQGSLPAFFAAFTTRKALSAEEIAEIRSMIDSFGEG